MNGALVEVRDVSKVFAVRGGLFSARSFTALEGISFRVNHGQTLGIVGESGSGKSTLLRIVLRLLRPTAGWVTFDGHNIWASSRSELVAIRRRMQAVFQDPTSSFNPRQRIGSIVAAPLEVHAIGARAERKRAVAETLELVGLDASYADCYPHQLSGGQRQRAAIARAIVLRPALVVADEPTSALDVSVQAQILNLFKQTKRELGLTCIFVSHNLGVIRYISDHVAVMRSGRIVETGPSEAVFSSPQHPYTRALLDAVPDPASARAPRPATLVAE